MYNGECFKDATIPIRNQSLETPYMGRLRHITIVNTQADVVMNHTAGHSRPGNILSQVTDAKFDVTHIKVINFLIKRLKRILKED